jgi:DNA-binding CsgD family transcriptional regulator
VTVSGIDAVESEIRIAGTPEAVFAYLVTALASDLLGGEIPEAVAAALHRQGEGNPFCLEELTRGLIEEGSLTRRDGRWALERPVAQRLPPGLTATIRSRLSRLPRPSLDVLVIGAVVGRGFDLDVVAAVSGSDPDTTEASLLPAVRGALVRPRADGSYAFTHDTIRETLYTDLAPGRARRLHLAIGEALESLAPQVAQGLAFHFVKAGDVERGVRYAQAAGEHALRAQAPASAVGFYQQAAELIATRPNDPRAAQVLLALGEAHTRTGTFNTAVTSFLRAAESAQRDQNQSLAADAWRRVGGVRWRQEQLLEARIAYERALELYGDADGLGAAEILLQLADLMALSLGQHADAERCATRALAMVRRLGDDRLAALANRAMGSVRFRANRLAEGRAFLEDALTLALRQDDAALAAEICGHLASAAGFAGDLIRSRDVTLLRRQLAQRTDDPFLLRHVAIWLGVLAVFQGRWEEVQAHLAEAAPDVERVDSPEPRAFLHVLGGLLTYYTGRFNAALVEFEAAQTTIRTLGSDAGLWFNGWTGMVLVELGRPAEAMASFLELRGPADRRDTHDSVNAYAYSQLIHGYHALGERQQAAECYARLLPFEGQVQCFVIDRALGVAAVCRGEPDAALRHLEQAVALAERADLRPELALAHLQLGLLRRHLGQVALAVESITQGQRLASELGMEHLARAVLERGLPTTSASPSLLSVRQLDVLRLVAQGRTNREIAEALVLTEGTVANHLTAVFSRIGADNRAAAVAYAVRHGLA